MSEGLPQTTGAFEWAQEQGRRVLRCSAIPVPHVFSTRDWDSHSAGDRPAPDWDPIAAWLGVGPQQILRPNQVHGDAVCVANAGASCGAADIIVTARADVAVAVQSADCVPLLFADVRGGAVAAAHAGWRGTAAGVAAKTMKAMAEQFGTQPSDLVVAIGPSIGPCCYRVGDELLGAFRPAGRRWFYRVADALMLNLWSANRDQLAEAGVKEENIHVSELCTAMFPELFHSYRRDGTRAGRLVAAIRSAPDRRP